MAEEKVAVARAAAARAAAALGVADLAGVTAEARAEGLEVDSEVVALDFGVRTPRGSECGPLRPLSHDTRTKD